MFRRVGLYYVGYLLRLLGETTTDNAKNKEETMAMEEPVGKSAKKDITIPVKQQKTPIIGEKKVIFFMS